MIYGLIGSFTLQEIKLIMIKTTGYFPHLLYIVKHCSTNVELLIKQIILQLFIYVRFA
jgi:hypothetical protein